MFTPPTEEDYEEGVATMALLADMKNSISMATLMICNRRGITAPIDQLLIMTELLDRYSRRYGDHTAPLE